MNSININSADQDAFDSVDELKGHGPDIVRYREERGGFSDVRQLDEVPGLTGKVSDETFDRLAV